MSNVIQLRKNEEINSSIGEGVFFYLNFYGSFSKFFQKKT